MMSLQQTAAQPSLCLERGIGGEGGIRGEGAAAYEDE